MRRIGGFIATMLLVASTFLPTHSMAISTSVTAVIPFPTGDLRITGFAFPDAIITILDAGSVAGTATANSSSFFDKTITGLSPTIHTIGIYAQSLDGRKTLTLSFNITIISGNTLSVGNILLPPVISVPDSEKRPAVLKESGLAMNNSTVTTFTHSNDITKQTQTDSNGNWETDISDTLHLGGHTASAMVNDGSGNQSVLTDAKNFQITLSADLNVDNLINLTDFSILMFNYGLNDPPNLAADINDDNKTDLVDFSVMMFYWTGG